MAKKMSRYTRYYQRMGFKEMYFIHWASCHQRMGSNFIRLSIDSYKAQVTSVKD